eukprot:COSAG02_NODE_3520_length_6620_cov_3.440423_5_plen_219_part_00
MRCVLVRAGRLLLNWCPRWQGCPTPALLPRPLGSFSSSRPPAAACLPIAACGSRPVSPPRPASSAPDLAASTTTTRCGRVTAAADSSPATANRTSSAGPASGRRRSALASRSHRRLQRHARQGCRSAHRSTSHRSARAARANDTQAQATDSAGRVRAARLRRSSILAPLRATARSVGSPTGTSPPSHHRRHPLHRPLHRPLHHHFHRRPPHHLGRCAI